MVKYDTGKLVSLNSCAIRVPHTHRGRLFSHWNSDTHNADFITS